MKKNYGLVLDKVPDPQAYVLGGFSSLPKVVLQPDGQWDAFLPEREVQNESYERYNCTGYGTNACLETLFKRLGQGVGDRSDRDLGIVAGTLPPGNDPHRVAQAAHEYGVIAEASLPNNGASNVEDYYTYKGGDHLKCIQEAQDFQKKYEIGHEYVWNGSISKEERIAKMKEALTYSPLGVSVSAWNEWQGIYVDNKQRNNHWTMCYGWNEKGLKIFDSYDNTLKILSYDHNIEVCKRYHIEIKNVEEQVSVIQKTLKLLFQLLGYVVAHPDNKPTDVVTEIPKVEEMQPKYHWDTPTFAMHSVRMICDEEGLTTAQKNTLCATIACESGFNTKAINKNMVNGVVASTDFGICQWNDYYHSKEITPEEAINNPEKAVRLMCAYWKKNLERQWVCYSSGKFAKYL